MQLLWIMKAFKNQVSLVKMKVPISSLEISLGGKGERRPSPGGNKLIRGTETKSSICLKIVNEMDFP